MTYRTKAIYRGGAFVPQIQCNLPEDSEVDLLVHGPLLIPPAISDPEERARVLSGLRSRSRQSPIPVEAPRYTRDELHERR